ncbi:O-acetyl-ADP-ribose deacetylase [Luteimonas sp. WGS1318]|uniref:O-acetyl-ADP-ribose deacetylase n=1 Tax=Luteimonas sp. WGS1318 TaxID=3366815 RepID=UPI00372D34A3
MVSIRALQADITRCDVDAIVNAANPSLLGGGGVDGAIHRAAGPALLQACRRVPEVAPGVRCPTGEARITPGFALPARHVVHTVGPVWRGGHAGEAALLAACYDASLALATAAGARSIAFPAISCGVYGYPAEAAVSIAVATVRARVDDTAIEVVFCCHDAAMRARYVAALDR